MYSLAIRSLTPPAKSCARWPVTTRRFLQHPSLQADYESKYAAKLVQIAKERGTTIEDLRAKIKEEDAKRRKQTSATSFPQKGTFKGHHSGAPSGSPSSEPLPTPFSNVRKDSSPVKPLSTFLNLSQFFKAPHTPDQISAIWTAYHVSRPSNLGRGLVCASFLVDTHHRMTDVARKYPSFVIPLVREQEGESGPSYEFYYVQWDFHDSPPVPSQETERNLFAKQPLNAQPGENPKVATVLFTPLQEYKLRQAFATPYFVLTFYTDLVKSHGLVLLRGEITPSAAAPMPSSADREEDRYLLSPGDAYALAMTLQKYYLWNVGEGPAKERSKEREELLKRFHENPADFKWEDLLKHSDLTAQ